MKALSTRLGLAAALLVLLAGRANAVPAAVPYVGYLTEDDGTPLERTVSVDVALYEQAEGGAPVWGPHTFAAVAVEAGMLSLVLGGDGSPALDAAVLDGGALWLAVSVDNTPLVPRQEVLSVPYALLAADAERLGGEPAASFVTDGELPDFGDFVRSEGLAEVATSGEYASLSGQPDLSVYLRADGSVALAGDLDAAGHQVLNLALPGGLTAPAAPTPGQLWWDSGLATLRVWTGNEWVAAGGAGSGGVAADLQCTSCVSEGELAFDLAPVATSGSYLDLSDAPDPQHLLRADGSVALSGDLDVAKHQLLNVVVHGSAAASPPVSPVAGQLWWDRTASRLKVHSGTGWVEVATAAAASDLACTSCVASGEVSFSWAAGVTAGGDAANAAKLGGYSPNTLGTPNGRTIPVTGTDGKIPEALLPFSQGDLLAPADRALVEGLGLSAYATDHFGVSALDIALDDQGPIARNVRAGIRFGPGAGITGTLEARHDSFAFWRTAGTREPFDDFASSSLDESRWTISTDRNGGLIRLENATEEEGGARAMYIVCGRTERISVSATVPAGRHATFSYLAAAGCDPASDCTGDWGGRVTVSVLGVDVRPTYTCASGGGGATCKASAVVSAYSNGDGTYDIYRDLKFVGRRSAGAAGGATVTLGCNSGGQYDKFVESLRVYEVFMSRYAATDGTWSEP